MNGWDWFIVIGLAVALVLAILAEAKKVETAWSAIVGFAVLLVWYVVRLT
jgi:hypothetical protein